MATDAYSADDRYVLEATVTLESQDVATNTSVVRRRLQATKNAGDGKWNNDETSSWSFTVNGATVSDDTVAYDFTASTPQTIVFRNDTITIAHDDDGTKTVAFSATSELVNVLPIGTASVSGSLTLPRIPRGPRVRSGGSWRHTVAYVRVGGVWKIAIPYVRTGGSWKVAGG